MIKPWVLTPQNIDNLAERFRKLDFSKTWEVVVRERKPKRSLEQNDRLWSLYRSIGNYLGYTEDDIHLLMGDKFLRLRKEINGVEIIVIKSTRSLSIKDMSDYQLNIEVWAAGLGWVWDE